MNRDQGMEKSRDIGMGLTSTPHSSGEGLYVAHYEAQPQHDANGNEGQLCVTRSQVKPRCLACLAFSLILENHSYEARYSEHVPLESTL